MLKRRVVPLFLVLLLSGCAATTEVAEESTPTPTTPPNKSACAEFAAITKDLASDIVNPPDETADEVYGEYEGRFDEVSLEADGEVSERVATLVDELPEKGVYWLYIDSDDYTENVKRVKRACDSEGFSYDMAVWS
ncbi:MULTISPECIES: hypothetical protein [unclassified Rathayibacter]|uniref:hypothetical protein n=1 Tax=unclassified Rathayibacter TaxID=2609250 RepID=UPI00105F65BF|nr:MULTISPECIES: hypothetical protein [unclassified Rathayibacter]